MHHLEANFRAVCEASSDAIVGISQCGRVLFVNPAAERLYRCQSSEIIGRDLTILMSDEDRLAAQVAIQRFLATGRADRPQVLGDIHGQRSDGSTFPARLTVAEVSEGSERIVIGALQDLTDLKLSEQKIANLTRSLKRLTREIEEQSAKILNLVNELHRQRADAKSANETSKDYLANVSHELRSPLTAILGSAELLLDQPGPDHVAASAERIRKNGRLLLQVVDNLLELQRIECGEAVLDARSFSPGEALAEVAKSLKPQIAAGGLTLELSVTPDVPASIVSDPVKFRHIIRNLLDNAQDSTTTGGILVRMLLDRLPDPPQLRVDVVDTGIGVSLNVPPAPFEPGFLSNDLASAGQRGSCVGMALCKRYCELLGGKVEISSLAGRGTSVSIWIAFELASAEPAAPVADAAVEVSTDSLLLGKRILIVDDHAAIRYLLQRMLTRSGVTVLDVSNGLLAVEAVQSAQDRREPIDAILLDMHMPVMDGYTAAYEIRRLGFAGPIIAVTADTADQARHTSLAAGCDALLTKPVERCEVINLLQRLFLLKEHRDSTVDQLLMWE